jgi:hypothetical protein
MAPANRRHEIEFINSSPRLVTVFPSPFHPFVVTRRITPPSSFSDSSGYFSYDAELCAMQGSVMQGAVVRNARG